MKGHTMTETNANKLFIPDKKQAYTEGKTEEKKQGQGQVGRPKKKPELKKSKKLILTLKPADYEQLKQYAELKELSINEYIRVAIKFYIQHSDITKPRY